MSSWWQLCSESIRTVHDRVRCIVSSNPREDAEAVIMTPADAFRVCRGELFTGITTCGPLVLANQVYSMKIISYETFILVTNEVDPMKRILSLMNAIEASLKLNPSTFYQLLAVLDAEPQLSPIAHKLRTQIGNKVC